MNDTLARIKDSVEISAVNGGAFFISMSEIEQTLRILSLIIAIAYTSFRLFNIWKGKE
tara:strand:+ start:635 stop:808 length:174 start_codon:yes stop_codon:yes gene_type:complete